jgi:hypothetical protein
MVDLTNSVNPLSWNVPIVDSRGNPTPEFQLKWEQQARTNASIPDLTTAAAVSAVLDEIGATRGSLLSRGASQWGVLAIGGANTILKSTGTDPAWTSLSSLMDTLGSARGDVLFRGAAGWTVLIPGTAGNVLTTAGAGADPSWTAPASGGGGAASIQDDGTNLYVALSDTDGQLVVDGSGDPIFSLEVLPAAAIPAPAGYVSGTYGSMTVNKVKGVINGSAAAAGDVGEVIQQITNFAGAVTYTAGSTPNIAQITLTPGDWDVSGVCALFASSCSFSSVAFGISQTTGTLPSVTADAQGTAEISTALTSNASNVFGISPFIVNVTVNTIMYLCINAAFTGAGTPKVWGTIRARRMR